jgi:sporulation protein YlmC with PRC-barrel domain
MKKTMLTIAGLGLASSLAFAQEQETQDEDPNRDNDTESTSESPEYEPNRDIVTDEDHSPTMSMDESEADSPVQTDYDSDSEMDDTATMADSDETDSMAEGLADMTASDLEGKKVVTLTGEEVGEISAVGTSSAHQDRIAVIDVGGFLGVGEKTIAIPLSDLQKSVSDEDSVRTSMTRTSLESQDEFDDSAFTEDE